MAKKRKDPNQLDLPFGDGSSIVGEFASLHRKILDPPKPPKKDVCSWEEDCIYLAVAAKEAIKESGMSREEVADEINARYGWPDADEYKKLSKAGKTKGIRHLSYHMLNHFLSKPTEYRMDAHMVLAIQRVTESLKLCDAFAREREATVVGPKEKRALSFGKLQRTLLELRELEKEFKKDFVGAETMNTQTITPSDLAEIIGVAKTTVLRRATKENCPLKTDRTEPKCF